MNSRIGSYITQSTVGESFKAYVPPKLPPVPALEMSGLYAHLEKATLAIAELNSVHKTIPNTALFIYMYVRKEALLSSQIEGTQSSFSDLMLFEHQQTTNIAIEDVEEVSNYVKAISYGIQRIKADFPLSLRLIKEIHQVLLSGTRGSTHSPGEFRRTQNWIGGTRPGNALFVPPPVTHLNQCLHDFEIFLHDESLPTLIKAGLMHVQFETIHPFLDGNGRIGRLLIILLLHINGMLDEPILYLSLYLKQNRMTYYHLLQEVRSHGTWETWLEFFLQGVTTTSKQAVKTANDINMLFKIDGEKIAQTGRAKLSCEQTLEYMKQLPQVTVSVLADALKITSPTARNALNRLTALGIIDEISGQKRDKIYIYRNYLDILQEGAEPLAL